ncbi:hypothetical protein [Haloarchaeobius baliensis]|uniref:hypothetical protein n=1 Tax=Haloarchaeobius baliensis TaxID=1670458 RepID=UPI003F882DAA
MSRDSDVDTTDSQPGRGRFLLSVLLGVLAGVTLGTGGQHGADFLPLVAGFVAATVLRRRLTVVLLAGPLAGLLSFLAAWLASGGRGEFELFRVEAGESMLVVALLGSVFAVLVGGIGAYAATLFFTEAGRDAWVRHWRRWWWW